MLRLVAEMRSQNLSQNRLAGKAAITPSDLSKIVNRRMVPYPGQLRKLATALGYREEDAHRLMDDVPDSLAAVQGL